MVAAIHLPADLTVYDLGAGDGALTAEIADRAAAVVAVERDPALVVALRQRFRDDPRIQVVAADLLLLPLPARPYAVVSNPAYNVTSELVRKYLLGPRPPFSAHLLIQREAADRFAGAPKETLMSLRLKLRFELEITQTLRPTDYWPVPRVQGALLVVTKRRQPVFSADEADAYSRLIELGFRGRGATLTARLRSLLTRRQLIELVAGYGLASRAAPSAVPFEAWAAMARFLARLDR